MNEITKLLADLVAIPSVNPMGRALSGDQFLEDHVADYVTSFLTKNRIDVERQEVFPNRPNVVGSVAVGAKRTLVLEAHMDTVPVDNMTIEPFDPRVKNGRLYGRGSCDTKASLAVILFVLKNLLKSHKQFQWNILLAAVSDEEYGLNGTRSLLNKYQHCHLAIVGEPTGLEVVSCHKGVVRWRMMTIGKSAHSAYPELGENAIFQMGRLLAALDRHAASLKKGKRHPMLGAPTLSVGIVEGGQSVNTVPSSCTIEIDRRTVPGETSKSVLAEVRRIVPRSVRCKISNPYIEAPPLDRGGNMELVAKLRAACRKLGKRFRVQGARYVTDASLYAARGIPAVVFGPGRVDQAHSEVEYVRLDEVETASRIYHALLTGN